MRCRPVHPLCLAFILLVIPLSLRAAPVSGLGMWIWSNTAFSTRESRQNLIQFCLRHNIRHLDVHTRISFDNNRPTLQDAEAFRELILAAGQHHISIASLRGDPKMFFPEIQGQTLRELRAIIDFSRSLPKESLFKGIKYDVEPYCSKEWKNNKATHLAIMTDYLSCLQKAKSILRQEAPQLWLAADIPFWWDKDEYKLGFDGKIKRFNEHIQDLTDYVVIMSYRRSVRKVFGCVEEERQYARRIHKVIFPSLETVQLKQDLHISFWGLPKRELLAVVPQLLASAHADPAMGGVMLHCYRSLYETLETAPAGLSEQTRPR